MPAVVLFTGKTWAPFTVTVVDYNWGVLDDKSAAFELVGLIVHHEPTGCYWEWRWVHGIEEEAILGLHAAIEPAVVMRLLRARSLLGPPRSGRPVDTGLVSLEEFPAVLRATIRALRRDGTKVSQAAVAAQIALSLSRDDAFVVSTLQQYLEKSGIEWAEVRRRT